MKALWISYEKQVSFRDVPTPHLLSPEDVKIKVTYCTIGELELCAYMDKDEGVQEGIAGHELAGVIVEAGEEAQRHGFHAGQRVTSVPVKFCGKCPNCLSGRTNSCASIQESTGALCEFVTRHYTQLLHLDDTTSDKEGCLIWTIAEALEVVEKSNLPFYGKVSILGSSFLAMMIAQIVKIKGAALTVMIDDVTPPQRKLDLSSVDLFLDYKNVFLTQREALKITDFLGYDCIFGATSNGEMAQKLKGYCIFGGSICFPSFKKLNYSLVFKKSGALSYNLTLVASYLSNNKMDMAQHLLKRLHAESFIDAEYAFQESHLALDAVYQRTYDKVGISFPQLG